MSANTLSPIAIEWLKFNFTVAPGDDESVPWVLDQIRAGRMTPERAIEIFLQGFEDDEINNFGPIAQEIRAKMPEAVRAVGGILGMC